MSPTIPASRPIREPAASTRVTAPRVWQVIWVDVAGHGLGACGHRHASADVAAACPFEPAGLPEVCAGLVRQFRDPDYRTINEQPRRQRPAQMELSL